MDAPDPTLIALAMIAARYGCEVVQPIAQGIRKLIDTVNDHLVLPWCKNRSLRQTVDTQFAILDKLNAQDILPDVKLEMVKKHLPLRALGRMMKAEERRQRNIEAIVAEAVKQIPAEVSSEPVNQDWVAHFFTNCQDVSEEALQQAWGRILAGEVASPGSFSRRTVTLFKNFGQEEAKLLQKWAGRVVRPDSNANVDPFVPLPHQLFSLDLKPLGISFSEVLQGIELGILLPHDRTSLNLDNFPLSGTVGIGNEVVCQLSPEPPISQSWSIPIINLSRVGRELLTIVRNAPADRRLLDYLSENGITESSKVRVCIHEPEVTPGFPDDTGES